MAVISVEKTESKSCTAYSGYDRAFAPDCGVIAVGGVYRVPDRKFDLIKSVKEIWKIEFAI